MSLVHPDGAVRSHQKLMAVHGAAEVEFGPEVLPHGHVEPVDGLDATVHQNLERYRLSYGISRESEQESAVIG